MPFQPSTLNKFLKLYSKYGFSGEDFLPPFNNTEKHYHNLRFEHKRNNTHYFLLTMTGSEGKNIVVGRIIYEPFLTKPYVAQSISKENENGLITHALKIFENWLKSLREELDAEEENNFIINPYFQTIPEEEMDKPFNQFEKQLYLKGVDNFIHRVSSAKIREEVKKEIIDVVEESKKELEDTPTVEPGQHVQVNVPTKRKWLKKLIAGLGVFLFEVLGHTTGHVVGHIANTKLFPEEKAQVYHITVQSFHFNYNNVFQEQNVFKNNQILIEEKATIMKPDSLLKGLFGGKNK